MPGRAALFGEEPVAELRGLHALTDPDDGVTAVVDLAVIGARGDGKSQFIVHAIRALHAHAPALGGAEQRLNQDVMRLVLDPRATRPDATPPGAVPHFTFRVRAAGLLERLRGGAALHLVWRATGVGLALVAAAVLVATGVALAARGASLLAVAIGAGGALVLGIAALVARSRIARLGDIEVVFWDIAGEQVYSAAAADYYAFLVRLVDARRRRAESAGRAYAFVPVLICNPLALGTGDAGSAYERLRELIPLFAAIDRDAGRALVAINRWSVVEPICARGALRDEAVRVVSCARGDGATLERTVAREQVRAHCLDAEDGRQHGVHYTHLRYDTAIWTAVEVDPQSGALLHNYDDGPGALGGDARHRFLGWLVGLVPWPRARNPPRPAASRAAAEERRGGSLAATSSSAAQRVPAPLPLGARAAADPERYMPRAPAPGLSEAAIPSPHLAVPPAGASRPHDGAAPTWDAPREPYAPPEEIWSRPLGAPGLR